MPLPISQMLAIVAISLCLVRSVVPQNSCGVMPGPGLNPVPGATNSAGRSTKEAWWLDLITWPWMVSIYNSENKNEVCGGALIDNRHIITSAHCFRDSIEPTQYTVEIGERFLNASSNRHVVLDVKVYENYKPDYQHDDIAIVLIERAPIDDIYPLCLPDDEFPRGGDIVSGLGWGKQSTVGEKRSRKNKKKRLQQVHGLRVVDHKDCDELYSYPPPSPRDPVLAAERFICTELVEGREEECTGDHGGILMRHDKEGFWILLGVAARASECVSSEHPQVYTSVPSYMYWIDEYLALDNTLK